MVAFLPLRKFMHQIVCLIFNICTTILEDKKDFAERKERKLFYDFFFVGFFGCVDKRGEK